MTSASMTTPSRPIPRPSPAASVDPYPTLVRAALLLAWVPGFGLGLYLLLGMILGWGIGGWLPLAQAHGHAQVFGFTALFVLGVGSKLFPRFLASPLDRPRQVQLAGVLIGLGVGARFVLQPLVAVRARAAGLVTAGALELVGGLLVAVALARMARSSIQPRAIWQELAALALISLLFGYLLNLVASLVLAGGASIVPPSLDEALLHLGIYGFIVPVTLAVAVKIFPQFLLLGAPRAGVFRPLILAYVVGTLLVVLGWLVQVWVPELRTAAGWLHLGGWLATTSAVVAYVVALRLFEPGARPSGMPHITNPTRLWFRLAWVWLLVAVAMGLYFAVREVAEGAPANFVEASAQRHALTTGYLLPLLVGMAGRILPVFSGDMTRRPRVLAGMVWLLLIGAELRVAGQFLGGYGGLGTVPMAVGATLSFLGFAWFAWLLWPTLGRPLGAPQPARS
jgi:uncharacterized protein involved in response to NO